MSSNNIKKVYDALKSSGYTDMGSLEEFTSSMSDNNNRKLVYDALSQEGYSNLGDFDAFSNRMSGSVSEPTPDTTEVAESTNIAKQGIYEPIPVSATDDTTIRGFVPAFEQSADQLDAGIKYAVGEYAEKSSDYENAYNRMSELIDDGVDFSNFDVDKQVNEHKKRDYYKQLSEWKTEIAKREEERKGMKGMDALKHRWNDPKRPTDPFDRRALATAERYTQEGIDKELDTKRTYTLIEQALKDADGNVEKAKALLDERRKQQTWGERMQEEAKQTFSDARPTEGFGAWLGNLAPQMVGNTLAVAAMTNPYTRWLARPLGMANMAALTASSGGSSAYEARKYGEEKGVEIDDATARRAGLLSAGIEAATEYIPFENYYNVASAYTKKKLGNIINRDLVSSPRAQGELAKLVERASKELGGTLINGKNIKEWVVDAGLEGLSEFMAEGGGALIPMIYQNEKDYPTLKSILVNGWEGAKAGMFMGAFLGGSSRVVNHYANRDRRKKAGHVDLAETTDGKIVEVLGFTGDDYSVMLPDGGVKHLKREELGDIVSIPFNEFDKETLSAETISAYEEGKSAEINQYYNVNVSAEEAFAVIEEKYPDMAEQAKSWVDASPSEVQRYLNDLPEDERVDIGTYLAAEMKRKGVIDGVKERTKAEVESFSQQLEDKTDANGNVSTATYHDQQVFVKDVQGDNAVIILDGKPTMVNSKELSNISTQNAGDVVAEYSEQASTKAAQDTDFALNNHPKTHVLSMGEMMNDVDGKTYKVVQIGGSEGARPEQMLYGVVECAYDAKTGMVQPKNGADVMQITYNDMLSIQNDYYNSLDAKVSQQVESNNMSEKTAENEGTPTEQIEQSVSEEVTDGQNNLHDTVGGSPVALAYLLEGGQGSILNAGYFLHGVAAAFPELTNRIEDIRHSLGGDVLGMEPMAFANSGNSGIAEIRDTIMGVYGEEGVSIFNDLLSNASGYLPKVGAVMANRIEELKPVSQSSATPTAEVQEVSGQKHKVNDKGVSEWYSNIRLSGELDQNDSPYVLAPQGGIDFGEITEGHNLPSAPIRLSMGTVENGYIHINRRHGQEIQNAGFNSIEDFVKHVVDNYTRIQEGDSYENKDGGKNDTYLIQLQDGHNNTLFVQLSRDGSYWNVNSAGVFNKKYGNNKKNIWSASEVQNDNSAVVSDGSQSESYADYDSTSNGTPSNISNTKGSGNVSDAQGNGQENKVEGANLDEGQNNSAFSRVPKNEKGEPMYESVDADTAWDAIVEETDGDTEMAQRVAADMLEDKKTALAKLQKGKPKKGATVAEKIVNEKAHAAAIAQAQSDVAQWEAIVGTENRRREAAMSEAERYAAEMEQKNISEGLKALGEPQSLEEYVLGQLAGGAYKLRWSDKENGTKGFGSHTGLSTEEMKARLSMIDNKNGLTPEEIAHSIVENMDASFGEVDVMDVTNMVIDAVATNANRRSMLNGMVESRAELLRQHARAEQEVMDAWYMEQYHATEEELAAYNEYLAEFAEEIYGEDTDYEQRIATFAEIQLEYDNQGTDAGLRSSADQGEGLTSDREGGRSVGEREQLDRRELREDADGMAEAEDGRAGGGVSAQSNAERIEAIKAELGVFGADNAAEYAARMFEIYKWKTLEEANESLKQLLASYGQKLNGQTLGVVPFLDAAQDQINAERDWQRYQEDLAADAAETVETLENGDVRITNRNSNGEIATVAIERDGKVISVDTYEDGALFEHTDYDANGNATKVTRYKNGEVVSEQEYKDGKRKVTANVFEIAEEAQKNRKSKEKSNDKLAEKNRQQEENRSETRGVGNRPQLQDASSYESFVERVAEYLQRSYKGAELSEEVEQIIRDFNKGKTILARTEQEKELLGMLRVMTNKDIDWLFSELKTKRDALTDEERKAYDDAVTLVSRYRGRGEHNAVVRALTGANLREKLPLTKIDELFDKYNSDADVAELYRRVRAIAEQIGLDFWFDDNMIDVQAGGFRGADNRVRFNAHMLYSPFVSEQTKASVIVHEILHAVADYAIETQRDVMLGLTPKVQLSKQVLSAADTILNIYEKAVKGNPLLVHEEYDNVSGEMKVVPDYGTDSAREMLMEISNPEFRDKLKQIEYKGRSVWQRIWDAFKSMFTKSSDITNPTAYDSMAKALDVLINEFSVDAYQKYSGLEESAMKLSADENLRFREKDEPKELIAIHNISEDNLKKVLEAGSLIMPSIAITKADMGHTGFGEISLLFDKDTIDPFDRRNKVYGGDAWTPRFPRIGVKLNEKVVSRINKKAYELIDDRRLREIFSLSSEVYPDNIEKVISDYGVEGYYNKEWMKLAYLLDNGKKVKIPTKAKDYGIASEDIVRLAKEKGLSVKEIYEDYDFYKNNPDFVAQVKNARDEARLSSVPEEQRDEMRERMQSRTLTEAAFDSYIRGALEMENDLAHGGLKEIVDRQALRGLIEKKVKTDNAEYNKWVDNLFEGIVEKRGIRNNRDWYTPSGNLRPWGQLYDPATPANILKYMLAENEQGGSGGFFDSNIMGASAETYESIEEIREKGKKRLKQLPYEEYDEWSNSIADRMAKICDDFLSPSQKNSMGGAIDAKIEITNAVAKDKTAKGIYKHMKREYPNFTMEHAKQVEEIVKEIQEFATGYFEAKPQRLVSVNEVMAAVVPSNASKEIVDALKNNGIEVVTYKKGDEEARKRVVKRVSSSMGIRFRDGAPFFSNAERAVENIKQQKATPEQWLAMIKKDGGLKAGEDKWMGLSDWLNEQKEKGVKTLTKDEVLAFIRDNQIEIEEVEYGDLGDTRLEELQAEFDELVTLGEEETGSIYTSDWADWAFEAMVDRYGDDFRNAFRVEQGYNTFPRLEADEDYDGNMSDVAKYFLGANPINSTRLDYTTEGLDNKKEIALVVPTIEPWNERDEVHFGDAGDGRAVAWVRFGETTDEDGNRVLVIDEVQSKRHDEGRAKGYQSKEKGDLLAERDRLYDKMYSDGLTEEEFNRRNEINARLEELGEGRIPDAPFDKNYHELVMKRMLRYAAENGFDKVAWTKGAQQAERYNLGGVVDKITSQEYGVDDNGDAIRLIQVRLKGEKDDLHLEVNKEGIIQTGGQEYEGKHLGDVVGKDTAVKLMTNDTTISGNGLRVGDEGRGALYDEMMPRFMNKYTKKWSTKVGEVTLPNVEEAGRTMWSVDVTPEMKESVMQGQPMFREGMGAISDREVSYENDPIAKFQGKPRYYGKRAAAFAERERRRMENAAKKASEMLGIEVEIVTDASTLQGRKAKAKGWYDIINKKVVVVVPNHVSMGDAVRTVLHEGVAHHGLRELFGDAFDAMLDNVYNNVSPELKARIDAIAERTGVSTSVATEEYLASLAEETNFEEAQRLGWWAKIKQYFVTMLNKLGMPGLNLKEELTDNELRYLLWRSYKNLVDPNSYLKPLGYIDDMAKQKELKVGEYAEKKQETPKAAETSEAEELEAEGWAAITMQRIEELEAQMAQLDSEIAEMEADRDADDEGRYDVWEQQIDPLRKQLEDVYAEIEGLYSLEAEDEDIEDYEEERESEKQRQLYQKRIDDAYLKAVRDGDWEEATDLFRQYVLSKAEDEGIVPMDYGVGYRGGAHSSIAKKVKEENPDAIAEAAYQMSIRIPKGSILVPMPSRTGNATYTVKLAEAIAKATDSEVRDVLKGKARMSVYEAKQKGIKMTPEDLGMYTTEELPKGKNIVIIDNVIDKGTTALAAVSAVKGASVVAYAYTLGDKQRVATLKLAEPVTYDDNKRIIPLSQRFDKETDDIRYRTSEEIEAEVEREAAALGVPVRIARSVDEMPDTDTRKRAVDGRLKGYFDTRTGEVVIYEPNADGANDVKRTILHEIVGHKGLRELIGEKEYDAAMVRLMYLLPSDVRDAVLRRAEKHAWNAAIAMDEYLAEKAEQEVTMPWWGRVNAWMRAMFRKRGFDVKLSDADVKYLLWRSRKKLRGDDAYDIAFDNKLKRAARQSARAEDWVKDNFTWKTSDSAVRERTKALSDMANAEYEEAVMSTQAKNMLSGIWYALKNGKKGFKSLRNDMAEAYVDGTRAVAEAQKAIEKKRGRKIRGYEDIHSAHNAKSSKDQREIFQLNDNILQPLSRAVANLINKAGKSFEEFSRYLNAKHGLERNVKFAERDAENESEKLRQNAIRSAERIAESRRERAEADYNDAVANLDALRNEGRAGAVGYASQSRKLKEQYDNKLAKIDTDFKAAIAQAEEDKKTKREELLKEYRKNDYSGLTAIFTMENEEKKPTIKELERRAQEYIDAFESSCDKNQLDLVWKLIRIATKFSVEKMYNSGLISKEQRDSMMNNFEYYVPLRGWKDDYTGDVYSYIASGNPEAVQQVIKHAKGRKSEADNILGTIFSMANYAIVLGNKNEVNLKLLNLAYNDPSGLLNVEETWYEETESGELVPLFPDMSDENLTSEQKMQKIEEYRAKVERLKNEGKAKLVRNPFKEGYPLHAKAWQEQQHAVMVKRGGEEFVVWVNGNPKLAQALNGLLHKSQREAEDNMMSNILRWMAATQTSYSPEFWLTNLQRDLITANTGNFIKYGAGYEKEFAKNLANLLPVTSFTGKKDKLSGVGIFKLFYLDNAGKLDMSNPIHKMFKEFADNGGMTGISQITDPLSYEKKMLKEIDKELSGIKSVPVEAVEAIGNGVEFINRGFENATRFATYMTSRQMGKGVTESIRDAKDVSVNFNMKGSGAWGNAFMRKYFIYFNAGIQGLRTVATWHEASKKRFYSVGGSVIAASVALAIINDMLSGGDDDDENAYYGLSEWNRYNFFNIKIGENSFLHWSLPQEYRPIYALGQIGYDLVSGRISNDRALKSAIIQLNNLSPFSFVEDSKYTNPDDTFLEAIIKGLVPSQVKPLVDAYITNEDFLGRRVHGQTDFNRDLPEYKRVTETTPQFLIEGSRVLSEISGGRENKRGLLDNKFLTNPSITWYLLKAAGGGTITFLGKFANMSKWDEEWTEVPILPKFVATSGDDYSKQRLTNDKYWKYRKGYEEIHKELTRNKNDEDMSKERKKEIEDELKQGEKYEYYTVLKKYESKYKKYKELIEKYEEEGNAEKEQEYRDKLFELKKKIVAEIEDNN